MSTQKLFYLDAYRTQGFARVLSCEASADGLWAVTLDQTLFYPTGGGQPCDFGTLGDANVADVREEAEKIVHLCDRPLEDGAEVSMCIDFPRRFVFMQQHTAEHIVSGLIRAEYGLNNVGFHMGAKAVTLDYDGELTEAQILHIARRANALLRENNEVCCFVPPHDALSSYDYRSKKALSGDVRLVEVPNADLCACCGLHVARTGEIGLVHLQNAVRFRGGTRLELLCGEKAEALLCALDSQAAQISALLSAKPTALSPAVERLAQELKFAQARCAKLQTELFELRAQAMENAPFVLLFEPEADGDALRSFANALLSHGVGVCLLLGGDAPQYRYVLAAAEGDLRQTVKEFNARFSGRGGGKPNFAQGSVCAERGEIEAFFREKFGGK